METMGLMGWLIVAALVLGGLASVTSVYVAVALRTWRAKDDARWRNFDGRFAAMEHRILGSTLPESPPLRPAFSGWESSPRESSDTVPSQGPPGLDTLVVRGTLVPPPGQRR